MLAWIKNKFMKKSKELIHFGEMVKIMRKERGWSQQDLANKSGLHRTYIGMIERAERNISFKNIEKLANVFRIKIRNFFDEY